MGVKTICQQNTLTHVYSHSNINLIVTKANNFAFMLNVVKYCLHKKEERVNHGATFPSSPSQPSHARLDDVYILLLFILSNKHSTNVFFIRAFSICGIG